MSTDLLANLISVPLPKSFVLAAHTLLVRPQVTLLQRLKIVEQLEDEICLKLQSKFVLTDRWLLSKSAGSCQQTLYFQSSQGMRLQLIPFKQIHSQEDQAILPFLKSFYRDFVVGLGLIPVRGQQLFMDFRDRNKIPRSTTVLQGCYSFRARKLRSSLWISLNYRKVSEQSSSVKDLIDQFYIKNRGIEKDQIRLRLTTRLADKIVRTSYNSRYYRIAGIIFGLDFKKTLVDSHNSLHAYYLKRYRIDLTACKSPVLVARSKKSPIYLIAQFCRLVQKSPTKLSLSEKMKKVSDFKGRVMDNYLINGSSPSEVSDCLDIKFVNKLLGIKGVVLRSPYILTGAGQVQWWELSRFSLGDYGFLSAQRKKCLIVQGARVQQKQRSQTLQLLQNASKSLSLEFDFQFKQIFQRDFVQELQQLILLTQQDILLIVLPAYSRSTYHKIKAASIRHNKTTQVVTKATLKKAESDSIRNLLTQMGSKLGMVPWQVSSEHSHKQKTFVGIHLHFDKLLMQSNLGLCFSIPPEHSSFISYFKKTGQQGIAGALSEGLQQLRKRGCAIQQLWIFRSGKLSEADKQQQEIKQKCVQVALVYIRILANNQLFFTKEKLLAQPQIGTVVDHTVVPSQSAFYLHSSPGTLPSLYEVRVNQSDLTQPSVHEVVFQRCFNYVNVSGSASSPQVSKYAKRLVSFNCRLKQHKEKSDSLYFL